MNRLIQLKAQLQRFAKALLDQTKESTLSEISKLIGCALLLTLALRSGTGCYGWPSGWPTPTPGPGDVPQAWDVQFFNCNHNDPGTGLPGRAYAVWARVDSGPWVSWGGLNPQPDPWTDCHDQPHQGASLYVQISVVQQGKWEFRLINLPLPGEPDCDSSNPDLSPPTGCTQLPPYLFYTVAEGPLITEDVTSP
jgi:hypothetical protein